MDNNNVKLLIPYQSAKQNNRLHLWLTVPFCYFAEDSRKQDVLVSNKIQYKQQKRLPDSTTKKQQKRLTRHQQWTIREMTIRPDLIGGHSLNVRHWTKRKWPFGRTKLNNKKKIAIRPDCPTAPEHQTLNKIKKWPFGRTLADTHHSQKTHLSSLSFSSFHSATLSSLLKTLKRAPKPP